MPCRLILNEIFKIVLYDAIIFTANGFVVDDFAVDGFCINKIGCYDENYNS